MLCVVIIGINIRHRVRNRAAVGVTIRRVPRHTDPGKIIGNRNRRIIITIRNWILITIRNRIIITIRNRIIIRVIRIGVGNWERINGIRIIVGFWIIIREIIRLK